MKIIVCIKQVPDTTEIKLDPVKGTLIREGVPSIMNPDDKGGLELALQLKERHGAEVTVVTMGPPQAEAILREAFAMGVDRAILLSDRKFAGADTLATSNTLAGALRKLEYDLIITGRQAIDGDTAQVGPQIAELLDLPQVTYVEGISPAQAMPLASTPEGIVFSVKKATEEGYEHLEVAAPCLMTVLSSAEKPRYMSVRGIVEAFDKPMTMWGFDDLDVDESRIGLNGSPTRVARSFGKTMKSAGSVHEVEPEQAVELIINKLREKYIL